MLILGGRFQPFSNGHLEFVKFLRTHFKGEHICIAIINGTGGNDNNEFGKLVNSKLSKYSHSIDAENNCELITDVLNEEGIKNFNVVSIPVPSKKNIAKILEIINCPFQCRYWVYAIDPSKHGTKEYQYEILKFNNMANLLGENAIQFPMVSSVDNVKIRQFIESGKLDKIKDFVPKLVYEFLKEQLSLGNGQPTGPQ